MENDCRKISPVGCKCAHIQRAVFAGVLISLTAHAWAQTWPTKSVRVIVPYVEGGLLEGRFVRGAAAQITIFLSQRLETALGQSVVPQYIPGGGGRAGTQAATKSAPDGYTFLYGGLNTIILTRAFNPRIGYDPIKDLIPVVQLGVAPYCVVVSSTSGARSVKDLVEQSRAKGAPVRLASPSSGSTSHLYAEMLARAAGIQLIHVPQKGSRLQALSTIRENRADAIFDRCGLRGREEGFFVSLAATGKERSQDYSNVPTLGEEGFPIDFYEWVGIFAPVGTAKEIVERMAIESSKIVNSSEGREFFRTAGIVVTGVKSEGFLDIIKHDAPRWAEVIRVSGAKRDF